MCLCVRCGSRDYLTLICFKRNFQAQTCLHNMRVLLALCVAEVPKPPFISHKLYVSLAVLRDADLTHSARVYYRIKIKFPNKRTLVSFYSSEMKIECVSRRCRTQNSGRQSVRRSFNQMVEIYTIERYA